MALSYCSAPPNPRVPNRTLDAFSSKFPKAQAVNWEIEPDEVFEASFKVAGKEMSANFNASGVWLETEVSIITTDLPQAVSETIVQLFPNSKVIEAEIVELPEQELLFEVELENQHIDEKMEAFFHSNGDLLNAKTIDINEDVYD